MKLFIEYLKLHYKSLLIFTSFSAVFILVFYLYSVPVEAVGYAVIICLFLGSILLSISFLRFLKKHKMLLQLQDDVKVSLQNMPEPENIMERDYDAIIRAAYSEKCRAQSEAADKMSDMTEYYTLWAHQIKTPISAMRLLLHSGDSEENEELRNQLFLTEEYVDMVLNYMKSDFNSTDYVIRRCDLDKIIKGALRKYAGLFISKKLTLKYDGIEKTVLTDEKWLSFVIGQILSNAIKYTNEGSVSIYLEGSNVLVIEDTGIGIAEEDLPRVCEEGYTGYNGRDDKKSTGIGLYLCKKILKNLSHRLIITSEVGVGTKVKIEFKELNLRFE